jgi:hypothetical protein
VELSFHRNDCKQLENLQGNIFARGCTYNIALCTAIHCHVIHQEEGTQENQPHGTTIRTVNTNFSQNQDKIQCSHHQTQLQGMQIIGRLFADMMIKIPGT